MDRTIVDGRRLGITAAALSVVVATCAVAISLAIPTLKTAIATAAGCGGEDAACRPYVSKVAFVRSIETAAGQVDLAIRFEVVLDRVAARTLDDRSRDQSLPDAATGQGAEATSGGGLDERVGRLAEAGAIVALSTVRDAFETGPADAAAASLRDAVASMRIEGEVRKLVGGSLTRLGMRKADALAAVEVAHVEIDRREGGIGGTSKSGRGTGTP